MSDSKIFLLLTFLFLGVRVSNAQTNLVPNSGFEVHSKCPDKLGALGYAMPWISLPYSNGSDLCDSCGIGGTKLPCFGSNDCLNFQYARTGHGMAAILVYKTAFANTREYVQVKLIDSLKAGYCYYVEFYTNANNITGLATNNLAVHFSKDTVTTTNTGYLLSLNPDIIQYNNPIIKDTANWIKVSGIYTAKGHEQYITIGSFADDAHTKVAQIDSVNGFNTAYYFIDDVSVTEITSNYSPTIEYRDTAITKGQSIFIGSRTSGVNCKWFTNGIQIADSVPGLTVSPSITTTYTLEEHIPCSSTVRLDTIVVTVLPKVVGIKEVKGKKVFDAILYPNPNNGSILNVATVGYTTTTVDVLINDVTGKQIFKGEVNVENGIFSLELNMNVGVYSVQLINKATNERVVKKLVITQ